MRQNTSYSRTRDTVLRRRRRTTMTTRDGQKLTGLNKRPHTGRCELCGQTKDRKGHQLRLEYHHWDDSNPNKGIWACRVCHVLCEYDDTHDLKEFSFKYAMLKPVIAHQLNESKH